MHELGAKELAHQFKSGKLSSEEIVKHFLNRIDKYDGQIGAFLEVYKERSLKKARELDQKRDLKKTLGKLASVPIALKDNIHVKGEITTCGSKFLTNYRAPFDATVTKILEEEDAIIIGKTNLDEFAMGSSTENSALKVTRNPWNLDYVPGGSSGGSSAAVAAGLCPLALGSDTGGSVRQPASLCGIFGFKPTYGRVSRFGLVAFGSSLDQIGPFAKTAEDMALIMEVIGKHDEKDATSYHTHREDYLSLLNGEVKGKKIGVPWDFIKSINEDIKENFSNAIEVFKKLGCEIVELDLNILEHSIATYYIIAPAEASTNLARFDGIRYGQRSQKAETLDQVYDYSKKEGFGPEVKKRILLGTYVLSSGYKDAYYKQATKVRIKMTEELVKAFDLCDMIAMPTSPTPAFKLGAIRNPLDMYLQDIFTIGANMAGLPAISVPSGLTKDGLPLGLQLMGSRREDVSVVKIAHAFEKAAGISLKPKGWD